MSAGTCCCPTGDRITSSGGCLQAMQELDLDDGRVLWTGNYAAIPGGCSSRQAGLSGNSGPCWNAYSGPGSARVDLTPLCKDAGIKDGGIYTIKNQYPDKWKNAELSWDGVGSHPMASVEFHDHVAWKLVKQISGNYMIKSQHPGAWLDASLSWDGGGSHPMASVEKSDPVEWKFAKQKSGNYLIINEHPGAWKGASLNWDGVSPHPRASVEVSHSVEWSLELSS